MTNDDDFIITFERAYTQNGNVLCPRTCYYLKNIDSMSAQERKDMVVLLDNARKVLSSYDEGKRK